MVPDLHALKHPTDAALWRKWITSGKGIIPAQVGSMMPAFSQAEGGPLTEEQISSLVDYLARTIPNNPTANASVQTGGGVGSIGGLPAKDAK
jgi:hypothetical protein